MLISYRDTNDVWTLGWGHNLEAHPDPNYPPKAGTTCTADQAEIWLVADVILAESKMRLHWPWMQQLPPGVYDACVELVFNMGVGGLATFLEFLRSLQKLDYDSAAYHLKDSKWYTQVKSERGDRLVNQVRRGQ
jgi:lysozyme